MKFIDEIKDQYDRLLGSMKHYLEVYDHKHDDWRLAETNWMLASLRYIRQSFGNVIYPELDTVEGAEALLKKARLEDELIEEIMMVSLLNIHVDEPYHEHKSKMEDLYNVVERLHKIDIVLLSNFEKFVPKSRLEEIDKVMSRQNIETMGIVSASLKK